MSRIWIGVPLAMAFTGTFASAQFSVSNPPPAKVPGLTTPGGGGYLSGSDDCTTLHRSAGTDTVSGVPFTTGTTGSTGQGNAICLFFSTTGITNDVWFEWSTTLTGSATFSTCSSTSVDTKAAIYDSAGVSSCPTNVLACNDDACSLQTSMSWPTVTGGVYTLQLGTFPGSAGGSGTFGITASGAPPPPPPPCGQYDDGVSENGLGLNAGGELAWMHYYTCLDAISQVRTSYNLVAAGRGSRIAIYEDADCDGDATTGLALVYTAIVTGGTVNVGTDTYNVFAINPPVAIPSGCALVAITADHVTGEFPAPMDQTNPTPDAWVMASVSGPGSLDLTNPNANALPPLRMTAIGFPTAWLLRARGQEAGVDPGTPTCFCEDSGQANDTPPACANGDADAGCANSTGGGTQLGASGSNSIAAADLVLHASGAPAGQSAFFFAGTTLLGNGAGILFGDGHRCTGSFSIRLQLTTSDANGDAQTSIDLGAASGAVAGVTRTFQLHVRDPTGSPCGQNFGTSNGYLVTFAP